MQTRDEESISLQQSIGVNPSFQLLAVILFIEVFVKSASINNCKDEGNILAWHIENIDGNPLLGGKIDIYMAEGVSNFWGPVTSSTEWCEKNYVYSSYIAEFYNTLSNMPCILLALIGLLRSLLQRFEKRFSVIHLSNMALAIGSMMYHATLQHVQQQSDETPMVWEMLLYIYILYSPDWHYRSTTPTFLFIYGILFVILHSVIRFGVGFKIHYGMLSLLCAPRMYKYYIYTQDSNTKRLAKLYAATLFLGCLCWLGDRIGCNQISHWPINPQGHALWHILMGFNSYFANTFLMFCRAQQLDWNPKVVHFMAILPYVKIEKPKTQ